MTDYDSTKDTLEHIKRVQEHLETFTNELTRRAAHHDESKLEEPEKSFFDKYSPLLSSLEYGGDEYKQALVDLQPALEHHYRANFHHPEHYPQGVDGMNLFDVVEMFCDWKAASERHETGDIKKSLKVNARRFRLSPQLEMIFGNTAIDLKWMK